MRSINGKNHYKVLDTDEPDFWVVGHHDHFYHWHPASWFGSRAEAQARAEALNGRLAMFVHRYHLGEQWQVGFYRHSSWEAVASHLTIRQAAEMAQALNSPD